MFLSVMVLSSQMVTLSLIQKLLLMCKNLYFHITGILRHKQIFSNCFITIEADMELRVDEAE